MILGISLSSFAVLHVAISLVAIVSGFAALLMGPLGSRMAAALTALFLASTLATSVTGFMFPVARLAPGHITGALTLVALVPTLLALYRYRLAGAWRRVYAIGAAVGLYLNVFIAVLHAFGKMTDGYWTTKHEWRTWEKPEYVETYRKVPNARYYEYRHDRDPDMGWRGEVVIHK